MELQIWRGKSRGHVWSAYRSNQSALRIKLMMHCSSSTLRSSSPENTSRTHDTVQNGIAPSIMYRVYRWCSQGYLHKVKNSVFLRAESLMYTCILFGCRRGDHPFWCHETPKAWGLPSCCAMFCCAMIGNLTSAKQIALRL